MNRGGLEEDQGRSNGEAVTGCKAGKVLVFG